MKPPWWSQVESEANAAIVDFTTKLRRKLAEPPEKLVTRKNPFLFRARVDSDAYEFAQMITASAPLATLGRVKTGTRR